MNELRFQRLDAYKVAKELARKVHEAKVREAELRDQATRADGSGNSAALRSGKSAVSRKGGTA